MIAPYSLLLELKDKGQRCLAPADAARSSIRTALRVHAPALKKSRRYAPRNQVAGEKTLRIALHLEKMFYKLTKAEEIENTLRSYQY